VRGAPLSLRSQLLDCLLGGCGIFLAYSAAEDFGHKHVVNSASGTLDEHATVTHAEMREHVFYQGVNLVQIVFLHCSSAHTAALGGRLALAAAATSVWLARDRFPVNPFSANYEKLDPRSTDVIRWLYRLKKYQYVFYKHFLLHGLNISVALSGAALACEAHFRIYWLLLNTSYVMEFFLQTLVKKGHLSQRGLLGLQALLMAASSLAALSTLAHVHLPVAGLSLALNFAHRHHDVFNTLCLLVAAGTYQHYFVLENDGS
jgi:hypothetical protein